MYSLAKDMLFLHGYFTRPEDLEPVAQQAPATPERVTVQTPRATPAPIGNVECGAC